MPRISDLPLTTSVDEATALIAVSSNGTTYKITPANLLASSGVGVSFYDSDSSHLITLAGGSNLSANRTLTLTTGDSNRTLNISAGDVTISAFAITILDDANAAAVRSTLGLGTMALETATDYLTVASAVSGYQPLDADLTTLAATITAFGHSLVDDVNAAAARTTLGLGTAAVENIGTSGATVPLLSTANTWSASQIISSSGGNELRVDSTTAGAVNLNVRLLEDTATAGPYMSLYRVSASPAASDQIGVVLFRGNDSTAAGTNYGSIIGEILDPTNTSEDGRFGFQTIVAGTESYRMTIGQGVVVGSATGGDQGVGTLNAVSLYENGTLLTAKYGQLGANNTWTGTQSITTSAATAVLTITSSASFCLPFTLISTNDDALAGPGFQFIRQSATPAASDLVGFFNFRANNSALSEINFSQVLGMIHDPTAASEDGGVRFNVMRAGAIETAFHIKDGVYVGAPTGFAKGVGTLNAVTLYENGTALTSKYGQLAVSNSWTASQGIVGTGSFFVGLTITSTNADANAGPYLVLRRAGGSPAASDQIGNITWQGQDSGLVDDNVANVNVLVVDPTAASEDYQLRFQVMIAGSLGTRGYFGGGLVVGSPTGGDLGGGTINASTYYQNGTVFSSVYGVLAGSNSWSNTNTFSSSCTFTTSSSFGIPATFISTNADANAGPYLYLYRNSASALASDIGPTVSLRMNDSAGTAVNTSEFYATVTSVTPGAVSANLVFTTIQSGSAASRLTLGAGVFVGSVTGGDKGANTFNATTIYENNTLLTAKYGQLAVGNTWTTPQTFQGQTHVFEWSDDGAATGPVFNFRRVSASPLAGDSIAGFNWIGKDSAGNDTGYGLIEGIIVDPTDASEDGRLRFWVYQAGTQTAAMRLGLGLVVGSPTGSEKGNGTINTTTLYEDGTSLASKYARLGSANTFTNPQRLPSYTVAGLPAGAAGDIAFTSNGRKNGEGAGAGTGVLVFHDGTAWRACDTGATVAA